MKTCRITRPVSIVAILAIAGLLSIAFLPTRLNAPVAAQQCTVITPEIPVIPPGQAYRQTNFVSDIPGFAVSQDPFLLNPWGITLTSISPFWVVNNLSSTTQIFMGGVSGSPLVLTRP